MPLSQNEELILHLLNHDFGRSVWELGLMCDLRNSVISAILSDLKKKGLADNPAGWVRLFVKE